MKQYFITSTDTDAGKTFTTCYFLKYFKQAHCTTLGLKPVACGGACSEACSEKGTHNQLHNDDALLLQQASSITADYDVINPITLSSACSPHIAARHDHIALTAKKIADACQPGLQKKADYTFIEGAGGWLVPINQQETMRDVAVLLQYPVILVVGIRLGCLNHALLTQQAIIESGLPFAGWVANCVDPHHAFYSDDIATLLDKLNAPLLLTRAYGGEVTFMNVF